MNEGHLWPACAQTRQRLSRRRARARTRAAARQSSACRAPAPWRLCTPRARPRSHPRGTSSSACSCASPCRASPWPARVSTSPVQHIVNAWHFTLARACAWPCRSALDLRACNNSSTPQCQRLGLLFGHTLVNGHAGLQLVCTQPRATCLSLRDLQACNRSASDQEDYAHVPAAMARSKRVTGMGGMVEINIMFLHEAYQLNDRESAIAGRQGG